MQKNKPLKLIIDTNLWIRFIISNSQNELDILLFNNKARLLFSEALMNEIELTITKPKLKRFFPAIAIREMLSVFEPFIDFVEVSSSIEVCRDPKDNFLLALAKDGKADYLLTGDKDLLALKKFDRTNIITIREFLDERKRLR